MLLLTLSVSFCGRFLFWCNFWLSFHLNAHVKSLKSFTVEFLYFITFIVYSKRPWSVSRLLRTLRGTRVSQLLIHCTSSLLTSEWNSRFWKVLHGWGPAYIWELLHANMSSGSVRSCDQGLRPLLRIVAEVRFISVHLTVRSCFSVYPRSLRGNASLIAFSSSSDVCVSGSWGFCSFLIFKHCRQWTETNFQPKVSSATEQEVKSHAAVQRSLLEHQMWLNFPPESPDGEIPCWLDGWRSHPRGTVSAVHTLWRFSVN